MSFDAKALWRYVPPMRLGFVVAILIALTTGHTLADEYSHGYSQAVFPNSWGTPDMWSPAGVPGSDDIANVYYAIELDTDVDIDMLNVDTYINYGPPPPIDIRGHSLNILSGGQWQWGGFSDPVIGGGVINQYGTMVLVDDINDHYNNGAGIVNPIPHATGSTTFHNYGTMQIDGTGSFDIYSFTNHNTYQITADADIQTIGVGGERTTNLGLFIKSGGAGESIIYSEFDNQGTTEIQSGWLTYYNSLQITSISTHELLGGKWVVHDGANIILVERGTIQTNQGHVVLDGSGANLYATQYTAATPIEDSLLANQGTLEVYGDRAFANPLANSGSLVVGHNTTLTTDLANAGNVSIGQTHGQATIQGNFNQGTSGQLLLDLGGLTSGDQHDALEVTGVATLAGTLNLALTDGFVPSYGDIFTLLSAAAVSGQFDTISGVMVQSGMALAVTYSATGVTATAALPGDANLDGLVNLGDLQILGDNWQSASAGWGEADFTGDGQVNLADLQLIGDYWNVSADFALLAQSIIPQPNSLAMLLIMAAGLWRRKNMA